VALDDYFVEIGRRQTWKPSQTKIIHNMSSIIRKRIYLNTCRFGHHNIIAPQAQMTSSN